MTLVWKLYIFYSWVTQAQLYLNTEATNDPKAELFSRAPWNIGDWGTQDLKSVNSQKEKS